MRHNSKLQTIVIISCIYLVLVTTIQAFKNPSLTETERFLKIPKNLIWQFDTLSDIK